MAYKKIGQAHTAMTKFLILEYARAKQNLIGEVSYDCKACFDQVECLQSNIYAQKQNVDENLLLDRDICVENIGRHAKMGPGVYIVTYK